MEKFENIKCLEDLKAMGNNAVMEFYNLVKDKLKANTLTKEELKNKYHLTIGALSNYLYKNGYKQKNGYFYKSKTNNNSNYNQLSKEELAQIRELLANSILGTITKEDMKRIKSKDNQKVCFSIPSDIADEWKEFTNKQGLFTSSEYVALALLEYMRKSNN